MSSPGDPQPGRVGGVEPHGPYYDLRVARVVEETHDSRSLVLDVPDALRERFRYRAGQFLTFRVEVDGHRLVRCYSLSSSPDTETEHKVTVKRVETGRVSNWMNGVLRAGDTLEVMHPAGLFVLQPRANPIVFFGGGSGITPVISLIKSALATTDRPLSLLYANRDQRSIIFHDELAELAAKHPDRLRVVHRLDDREGFVDAACVGAHAGGRLDADFYICGPGPFMDVVEGALHGLGVAEEHIFIERFEHAEPDTGLQIEERALPVDAEGMPQTLTIALDGATHEVPYHPGDTVLETARRAGLEPPFSCEEGYCSCCMARIADGKVEMRANDCLDPGQVEQGWALTCQSVPTTPKLRVEYPD